MLGLEMVFPRFKEGIISSSFSPPWAATLVKIKNHPFKNSSGGCISTRRISIVSKNLFFFAIKLKLLMRRSVEVDTVSILRRSACVGMQEQ